jgi:heterodisulfide reductase subunit A2
MSSSQPQLPAALVRTEVVKRALVLGNGLSATLISLELAGQGFDVDILLPVNELVNLSLYAFPDDESRNGAAEKMKSIGSSPSIRMHRDCQVSSLNGSAGDFEITFTEARGNGIIKGGAVVFAQDPFLVGGDMGASVVSNSQLRDKIEARGTIPNVVVFIEGSEARGSCPAQGTTASIENALAIRERRPETQVYIMARDVGAPGAFEQTYQLAQEKGIIFFRGDFSYRFAKGEPGNLIIRDPIVGEVKIRPGLIVRDEVFETGANSNLARKLGLSLSREGQALGLSTRLYAGETIREGVFVCHGLGASILASENISEAYAVASSVSEMLSKNFLEHGAEAAFVDKEKCSACLACVRICPYDAPFIDDKGKAEIRVTTCQGCGICVSLCPSKAIDQRNWTDAQLSAGIATTSKGVSG